MDYKLSESSSIVKGIGANDNVFIYNNISGLSLELNEEKVRSIKNLDWAKLSIDTLEKLVFMGAIIPDGFNMQKYYLNFFLARQKDYEKEYADYWISGNKSSFQNFSKSISLLTRRIDKKCQPKQILKIHYVVEDTKDLLFFNRVLGTLLDQLAINWGKKIECHIYLDHRTESIQCSVLDKGEYQCTYYLSCIGSAIGNIDIKGIKSLVGSNSFIVSKSKLIIHFLIDGYSDPLIIRDLEDLCKNGIFRNAVFCMSPTLSVLKINKDNKIVLWNKLFKFYEHILDFCLEKGVLRYEGIVTSIEDVSFDSEQPILLRNLPVNSGYLTVVPKNLYHFANWNYGGRVGNIEDLNYNPCEFNSFSFLAPLVPLPIFKFEKDNKNIHVQMTVDINAFALKVIKIKKQLYRKQIV